MLDEERIPTDDQREALLRTVLEQHAVPGIYALCDLLGWLADRGRSLEFDAVLRTGYHHPAA